MEASSSWVHDLWRAARLPTLIAEAMAPLIEGIDRLLSLLLGEVGEEASPPTQARVARFVQLSAGLLTGLLAAAALHFILTSVDLAEVRHAFWLRLHTLGRVMLLLVAATLIWTPIGVAIGFRPGLAQLLQPLVQILASFPANFLFPIATVIFLRAHVPIGWRSILLMALGAQWYILFNAIAGAQTIPSDLREMADAVGLRGLQRWRQLILPGIFSAWVTGVVTASGGAWNASIVAEVVSWGGTTLQAEGLGPPWDLVF